MLLQFYNETPQASEAYEIFQRLTRHQQALENLRKKKILEDAEWQRTSSYIEKMATQALYLELEAKPEEAIAAWRALKEEGTKLADERLRMIDKPEYRPWIHLAEAKLEAYGKSKTQ